MRARASGRGMLGTSGRPWPAREEQRPWAASTTAWLDRAWSGRSTVACWAVCAPAWVSGSASRRSTRGSCSSSILFVLPGSQLLIYPLLWILMPTEHRVTTPVDAAPGRY